jgi:starch synthase
VTGPKVCLVSSEVAPFAKTGGLGDVVAALTKHLHRKGCDVRTFLPLYGNLKPSGRTFYPVDFLRDLRIQLGPRTFSCSVETATLPGTDVSVYFVRNEPLYGRAETYSGRGDEHLRFACLSKVAIECCQRMGWAPDVFHCNDWHTSLIPLLLKTEYSWDRLFRRVKTLLTIHNVGYQGSCPASALADLGLERWSGMFHQEHLRQGKFSFLETGILHADALSTVSETHAVEMTTPEYGMGLDSLLRARRGSFVGIVNGIDAEEWDPSRDPNLARTYSAADLSGKEACKRDLLARVGLSYVPDVPVFAIVSRMTLQKGFDLCVQALPHLLATRDVRLVVLGTGEQRYESFFAGLQRRFAGKARFQNGYDNAQAHRIEAGADLFLMPSLYEPCGLNQMYSLRYGTLPIVRRTGGLADTVKPWDPATGSGTGVLFEHYTADGLRWAIETGLRAYADRAALGRLRANGMAEDWSWDRQIGKYLALYRVLSG